MKTINKMTMKLIFILVFLLQALFASTAMANITPIISWYLMDDTSIFLSFCSTDNGNELWKSNGTVAGTTEVKDIYPGGESSNPEYLTDVNGTIFFQADDGANGKELWKSNGTEAGTEMVKDIDDDGPATPKNLTNVNGTLFFVASDGDGVNGSGDEIWKSNGTEVGTVRVQDLKPGTPGSNPSWLTNVGGTLFFQANLGDDDDTEAGNRLWKSDGTINGIVEVKPGIFNVQELVDVNGVLFFRANGTAERDRLYRSDGTPEYTYIVADIDDSLFNPTRLTNVNGTLFFAAYSDAYGNELWASDGTIGSGTEMVMDIHSQGVGGSSPEELININSTLFFSADDGVDDGEDLHGRELWKSDGSETGTVLVKDINESGDSNPTYLTNVDGVLFFSADDGMLLHGRELWKSDGTSGGTMMVVDIMAGDTNPYALQSGNGILFFKIDNNGTEELWISDGTEGGTVRIKVGCEFPEE